MRKIEEYNKHAAECRQLAATASSDEHRRMLLEMAEAWERLARDRPEQIARQERISALENNSDDK